MADWTFTSFLVAWLVGCVAVGAAVLLAALVLWVTAPPRGWDGNGNDDQHGKGC